MRDVVEALWRLSAEAKTTATWNVASGEDVCILDLAKLVERSIGRRIERTFGPRRHGDVMHSAVSAARLRRLGSRPEISPPAGLAELVDVAASLDAACRNLLTKAGQARLASLALRRDAARAPPSHPENRIDQRSSQRRRSGPSPGSG